MTVIIRFLSSFHIVCLCHAEEFEIFRIFFSHIFPPYYQFETVSSDNCDDNDDNDDDDDDDGGDGGGDDDAVKSNGQVAHVYPLG